MNELPIPQYQGVTVVDSTSVKTFVSSDEMKMHFANTSSSWLLLTALESCAPEFAYDSALTDRLKTFAEMVVAACVATKLTSNFEPSKK